MLGSVYLDKECRKVDDWISQKCNIFLRHLVHAQNSLSNTGVRIFTLLPPNRPSLCVLQSACIPGHFPA